MERSPSGSRPDQCTGARAVERGTPPTTAELARPGRRPARVRQVPVARRPRAGSGPYRSPCRDRVPGASGRSPEPPAPCPRTLRFIGRRPLIAARCPTPWRRRACRWAWRRVAMDEALLAMAMTPSRFPRRADFARVSAGARRRPGGCSRAEAGSPARLAITAPRRRCPTRMSRRAAGGHSGLGYERITYDSGFSTRAGEPGGERWMAYEPNRGRRLPSSVTAASRARGSCASTGSAWASRSWTSWACIPPSCTGARAQRRHAGAALARAAQGHPREWRAVPLLRHDEHRPRVDAGRVGHPAPDVVDQGPGSDVDRALRGLARGLRRLAPRRHRGGFDAVVAGIPVADFPSLFQPQPASTSEPGRSSTTSWVVWPKTSSGWSRR